MRRKHCVKHREQNAVLVRIVSGGGSKRCVWYPSIVYALPTCKRDGKDFFLPTLYSSAKCAFSFGNYILVGSKSDIIPIR